MLRIVLSLAALLTLAACGADNKWASDEAVAKARYVDDGPPTLTLFTVLSNRSDAGAHLGLMISGSQRIMFDAAGSFYHPNIPERADVLYGFTPAVVDFYIDYHARVTYRVVKQDLQVSPEVAEQAIRLVEAYGAVPKAFCTKAITDVLRQLPGFESMPSTFYPKKAMEAFGRMPGVTTEVFYDDDPDKNGYILTRGI
ncbi:MAG TPA: hypothetical protein ENK41_00525 [Rhodobacteraceae bacterium]|nr:hypothetical protein [Paracoccaceae bacterium]